MIRLSSIRVWQKLVILGLLSAVLCAVPTLLYVRQANKEIDVVKQELRGLAPLTKLLSVIQHMQQHRGLSSGVLSGNAALSGRREAKERDVTAALTAYRAIMPGQVASIMQAMDKTDAEWKSLTAAVKDRSYPQEDSFNRHTKLIANLMRLLEATGDYYGLSLDPERETYYTILASYGELPRLTEALGQLRARGTAMLSFKQATGEDRVMMASLINRAREHLEMTQTQMGKAFEGSPELKAALETPLATAQNEGQKFIAISDLEFVRIEVLRLEPTEYFDMATRAIDAQFNLVSQASVALNKMLTSRLNEYRLIMYALLGVVAALFAIAALLMLWITRSIVRPLTTAVGNAESIAAGRLDTQIPTGDNDELGQLLKAMQRMQTNLGRMVAGIRESSEMVASASQQIASSTQDMSARTEEQASSLEETSASMEEMNSTVQQNDSNGERASELAAQASNIAQQGGMVVKQMAKTMADIELSSKKIADITSVIDGIAFQTNILALNAAVEAARAGEQGRGFAVVATEVRTLAQRSGQAAKEIRALIADAAKKVGVGAKDAAAAGKTMETVVSSIKRVADAMSDIRIASREQLQGISQVTRAVEQMNTGTQHNTAIVEQVAATADMLSEQAQRLLQAVAAFKLTAQQQSKYAEHKNREATPIDARRIDTRHDQGSSYARVGAALPTMRANQAMLSDRTDSTRNV